MWIFFWRLSLPGSLWSPWVSFLSRMRSSLIAPFLPSLFLKCLRLWGFLAIAELTISESPRAVMMDDLRVVVYFMVLLLGFLNLCIGM